MGNKSEEMKEKLRNDYKAENDTEDLAVRILLGEGSEDVLYGLNNQETFALINAIRKIVKTISSEEA